MLDRAQIDGPSNELMIKMLTDDPRGYGIPLGCSVCPTLDTCGGLCVRAPIMDCNDLCCGSPGNCTTVCRNKPRDYVQRIREIGDYRLRHVERAPTLPVTFKEDIIPLVYHGSSRAGALQNSIFALRLPDLVNFRTGELRFTSRQALCAAYRISPTADLVLTGVNQDKRIEPWWGLADKRISIIQGLVDIGIKLVTVPNFSVILNQPRHDDLHAMKRIALLFAEFQNAGMACALHPNGRTTRDFARWSRFIAAREEVQTLSYEFTTGPGRKSRIGFHLDQLARLADNAGRELDIVIFGKPDVIPTLRKSFRKVTYIETTSFMKSIKRQRAYRPNNEELAWAPAPTGLGEVIDPLFVHNLYERILYLTAKYYSESDDLSEAA